MHFYHEYSSKFAFKYLFAHKIELNNGKKIFTTLCFPGQCSLDSPVAQVAAVCCCSLFVFLNSQENHEKRKRKMLNYLTAACLVEPSRRLSRDFVS